MRAKIAAGEDSSRKLTALMNLSLRFDAFLCDFQNDSVLHLWGLKRGESRFPFFHAAFTCVFNSLSQTTTTRMEKITT